MTSNQALAIEVLREGLFLLALWGMYFVSWHNYRIDAFRQRLFNLRGELFNYALAADLPFDHPAYGLLRARINRMIRWGHQFSAIEFVLLLMFMSEAPMPRPHKEWEAEVERIEDPAIRARLKEFEEDLAYLMVKRLAFSPIVFPIFLIVGLYVLVQEGASATVRSLSAAMPGLERLEARAAMEESLALAA